LVLPRSRYGWEEKEGMKHVRKWDCAVCGGHLIYDDVDRTLFCKCGSAKADFVNPKEFVPVMGSENSPGKR
jgi:hypothetical protein